METESRLVVAWVEAGRWGFRVNVHEGSYRSHKKVSNWFMVMVTQLGKFT